MSKYILQRVLLAIPTLFGITVLIFVAMRVLPGDPLVAMQGGETAAVALTEEELAILRHQLGLDRPLHVQYVDWIGSVLRGDLGTSFFGGEPVVVQFVRRMPITIEIAVLSVVISWLIGIPLGVLSALKRNTLIDAFARFFSVLFVAIPSFWMGMVIVMVGVLVFLWRPPISIVYPWVDIGRNLQIIAGPSAVMGIGIAAVVARFTRSALLEVLGEDYVRTARAKGLPDRRVIWPHALKNAMLPVITVSGSTIGGLLGGAVAVETAFSVPGLGTVLTRALNERDYIVVQNLVLFYGILFLLVNLAVDISYAWFDPRIKFQ